MAIPGEWPADCSTPRQSGKVWPDRVVALTGRVLAVYGIDPSLALEARLVMTPTDQWVDVRLALTRAALDALETPDG